MAIAFVFPGQGSQFVGMGKDLAEGLLDQASQILGLDLKSLCLTGPEDELKKTSIQQPAIFTICVAAFDWLKKKGLGCDVVAGHSLGEYAALYAAGSLSFEAGVKLVHRRGLFMQEAVKQGEGAMAALLGGDLETINNICAEVGNVWPANFNSPGQIVISGEKSAVDRAGEKLKTAGVKRVIPLAVSAPFHCPLMQPAADKLAVELAKLEIKEAKIPVISNVTAGSVTNGQEIKNLLIKQVTSPVLWEDSIKKIVADGIFSFVEVGPGKVLSGLIKKITPDVEIKSYLDC